MTGPDDTTQVIDAPHSEPESVRIRDRLAHMDGSRERLFRVNSGTGWVGRVVKRSSDVLVLGEPRPLKAAPIGWPDLCGWETVEITPDMVGLRVAVFVAEEFKGRRDALRPEQLRFRDVLERMGGVYRVVRPIG